MKQKKIIATIITAMLIILTACNTADTALSTIKIGFIGPLTGTASTYGIPELQGAQLAVDELNKNGGINGKQIQLIVEDGKCEGVAATTAAKKLIEIDQVSAILGGHCSTESMTILPITEQSKTFIMAGATGTDKFSGAGAYSFRTFPSAKILYGKLAEFAFEQGARSIATLADQGPWPQSVVGNFATRFKELSGTVVTQENYAPGTTDFKTQLLKIKNLNPNAIMISVQGPDTAAIIIKQMNELDMNLQIYGDALTVSKPTYEKSNGLLPETAIGGTIHIESNANEETNKVLALFITRFGAIGLDPFYITESYDGTMIIAELVKQCDKNSDCMRKHILSKEWLGATNGFRFDENGDATAHIAIKQVKNGSDVFLWKN